MALQEGNEGSERLLRVLFRDEMAAGRFSVAMGHRRLAIIDLSPAGRQPMASADATLTITFNVTSVNDAPTTSNLSLDPAGLLSCQGGQRFCTDQPLPPPQPYIEDPFPSLI